MLAKELQPGMLFKRAGHNDYREAESIRDLDKDDNAPVVMRNKLEITCTNGDKFWIYKTDTVHLQNQ